MADERCSCGKEAWVSIHGSLVFEVMVAATDPDFREQVSAMPPRRVVVYSCDECLRAQYPAMKEQIDAMNIQEVVEQ